MDFGLKRLAFVLLAFVLAVGCAIDTDDDDAPDSGGTPDNGTGDDVSVDDPDSEGTPDTDTPDMSPEVSDDASDGGDAAVEDADGDGQDDVAEGDVAEADCIEVPDLGDARPDGADACLDPNKGDVTEDDVGDM